MPSNFAVFILTNGRAGNVKTYSTLKKLGYTGKIYLIVDDLDKSKDDYLKTYGKEVVVFPKLKAAELTDAGDNFGRLGAVVFARNYSFKIAEDLGVKYFVQLDDDYSWFQYRFDERLNYNPKGVKDLDKVFSELVRFLEKTGTTTIALSQGGDFIGGEGSSAAKVIRATRKAMNSFVCSTDRPFKFYGRINEDVTAYVLLGSRGKLFFTTNQISLEQGQTQTNPGGLTGIYLDLGTYVKSFYSVMYSPSSVKVRAMGDRGNYRLHHAVDWGSAVPKILREKLS
jgi:hypothetical protein